MVDTGSHIVDIQDVKVETCYSERDEKQILSNRHEMPWNDDIEQLFQKWSIEIRALSAEHEKAGYVNKRKFGYCTLPNIFLSLMMGALSGTLPESDNTRYITVTGFVVSGLLTTVSNHYKFGKKQQQHFDSATRFSEVATEIESELIKPPAFRLPADVFLTRVKMIIDQLKRNAPNM